MREIARIIVHHSASPRSTTIDEIRAWHVAKGWSGVGYHFVVEEDGTIKRGRDIDQIGAHAKGANADSIGICVAGNNVLAGECWTPAQRESLIKLCHALQTVFGPLVIEGHRWARGGTTATECPGLTREEWEVVEVQLHG